MPTQKRAHWFVGLQRDGNRIAFRPGQDSEVTEPIYGRTYAAVIGPFVTRRGARYAAWVGQYSPLPDVAAYERAAKTHKGSLPDGSISYY